MSDDHEGEWSDEHEMSDEHDPASITDLDPAVPSIDGSPGSVNALA